MRTEAAAGRGSAGDRDLLRYLRARRWFGEKGSANLVAELADVIPVRWPAHSPASDAEYLVARVRVRGDGEPVHYQLFLRAGDSGYADALEDEGFRRGIVGAFAGGATFEHQGRRWIVQSETQTPLKVPDDAVVRLSSAEQSNTSIIVGTQAVLKLFRKVAPGVHPDIEVTRFLTVERRFIHTPALLGTISFADDYGAWAAGMLQELVPGATDGWTFALECARPWFASGAAGEPVALAGEAEQLGRITREMHEALASGDPGSAFERQQATEDDLAAWADATAAMMRRAMQSAGRAGDIERLEKWIRGIAGPLGAHAGAKIRIHGDYHLGQVLRSMTNTFLVVDFEGEPARPLEERRRPHSPLRDVAGMLRSFAYAAATLGEGKDEKLRAWELAVREAFLRGYFAGGAGNAGDAGHGGGGHAHGSLLPSSREHADRLIALFEAEKAFYELQYELDHRPDWVWIPLRAIERIAGGPPPSPDSRRP